MRAGNFDIKRTYRPARMICDVLSLAALAVVSVIAADLLDVRKFLGDIGLTVLLFPAAGIAMCAVYAVLTFRSRGFKRYKLTGQNAQAVYDWWAFSLALVKLPLLAALVEGELMFRSWAADGRPGFSVLLILYVLLAVIIIRLMLHRIRSLTEVKKTERGDQAVKVKAKIADDDKEK